PLAELDPDEAHQRAQGPLHLGRVLVGHDGPAFAFVALVGRLADHGQAAVDHELPDGLLGGVEAVHGDHALPLTLPAEERGARGPHPAEGLELAVHHQVAPSGHHVGVVDSAHQRHQVDPGGARADLADHEAAVGPLEPLHVAEAGAQPEGLHGGHADGREAGVR
ncbi:MAG: hypothetical protein ACK559_34030, partial [bacterium]